MESLTPLIVNQVQLTHVNKRCIMSLTSQCQCWALPICEGVLGRLLYFKCDAFTRCKSIIYLDSNCL